MIEVVDCNVAKLAAQAEDWSLVSHIVVEAESRNGVYFSFWELGHEGEGFDHADFGTGLLESVDKDLLVD